MIKLLFILFLYSGALIARENPFFPAEGETDLPITSNLTEQRKLLKQASLTLPSTARIIESFSVTYKNLDGSIATKTVELNNNIDWHLPLFLTQSYQDTKSKISLLEKSVQSNYTKLGGLSFFTLYTKEKDIKLLSSDKLIRNFMLTDPHRIVCDLKRDIDIRSFTKNIDTTSVVKSFRVGNHKGYYRIVIELDGYYKYELQRIEKGYLFKLI
ncbi:MAG: AMIN domain-containing protein [Campylobacterales bacterium]|nr:AMIN domain-containing protein [Campylobacterales bacterium]